MAEFEIRPGMPEQQANEVRETLAGWKSDRSPVGLLLAPDKILRTTIILPSATRENLREVLAFEMDRNTPFCADAVYFDYRILPGADQQNGQLLIELAVARRGEIDQALKIASALGLTVDRIAVADPDAVGGVAFDLMPRTAAARKSGQGWRRVLLTEGAIVCLLAAVALFLPIIDKQHSLAASEARLTALRADGEAAATVRARVVEISEQMASITQQRLSRPPVVVVLAEITRALPDHTWLSELSWAEDDLYLSGYSEQSASLIELLEESEMFKDARFVAPVTSDPGRAIERFNIAVTLQSGSSHR